MAGPLTIYAIDQRLRAAGLAPWSPDHRDGWTVSVRHAWFYVTGDVGNALDAYRPEPVVPGCVRLRTQPARNRRHDAVVAQETRGVSEQCEEPSHRFRGKYTDKDEAIADVYVAGLSLAEIAEGFGMTRERVRQVLDALGIARRPRGAR